jgi:hypothetical protein
MHAAHRKSLQVFELMELVCPVWNDRELCVQENELLEVMAAAQFDWKLRECAVYDLNDAELPCRRQASKICCRIWGI